MPLDIDEIIARAKRPQKTVPVCLRGDLQADWEDLERQLKTAQENTRDDSLAGNPEIRDLADRMADLGKQMADSEVVFTFQGLSAMAYSNLLAKYKAADDEESVNGLDMKTYPAALIAACSIDPPMSGEQAEALANTVTDWQWDSLFEAALNVNRSSVNVPFSLSASAIRASTAPSSKRPAPGVSPAAASSDASLFEPPSTSTAKTGA